MPKSLGHIAEYQVKLSLIKFEEDGIFFIYSPALDLTGYGKSEAEARKSFDVAMEEFLTYTTHKETVQKALRQLGWTVTSKNKITVPSLSELIQTRSYLEEIFTEKEFRKVDENFAIPA